ncbi:MAG: NADH-quinone oxidoreductase subunit NuoH [Crenarchaeota archaeon]|nr:NADH-quinone oxidoreductase subunit NuoH [Thermoproteota archaeon]
MNFTKLIAVLLVPGLGATFIFALVLVWLERKLAALVQHRYGPLRVSPFEGILQPIADFIKLLVSEIIIPEESHKLLFISLPLIFDLVALLAVAFIPAASTLYIARSSISLIIILFLLMLASTIIAVMGWIASDKFTYVGAVREVLQSLAAEIPLILSFTSVILLTRTLDIYRIVLYQKSLPLALLNPLAFIVFIICALMATSRFPFEVPEAETEIVFGPYTEYSGALFALSFLGVYVKIYVYSMLASCLFLGGWYGPLSGLGVIPQVFWTYLKASIVAIFMVLTRAAYPRIRIDQVLRIGLGTLTLMGTCACALSLLLSCIGLPH